MTFNNIKDGLQKLLEEAHMGLTYDKMRAA